MYGGIFLTRYLKHIPIWWINTNALEARTQVITSFYFCFVNVLVEKGNMIAVHGG